MTMHQSFKFYSITVSSGIPISGFNLGYMCHIVNVRVTVWVIAHRSPKSRQHQRSSEISVHVRSPEPHKNVHRIAAFTIDRNARATEKVLSWQESLFQVSMTDVASPSRLSFSSLPLRILCTVGNRGLVVSSEKERPRSRGFEIAQRNRKEYNVT